MAELMIDDCRLIIGETRNLGTKQGMIPDEHVSDEDLGAEAELFFKIGP
jgi:hypothetical protein